MKLAALVRAASLLILTMIAAPRQVRAQGDEIQVYDGGLAPVGVFNITWHNNFTPKGIKEPAFPGAVISHHSLNGVPEWALGVTRWFEAGLYLPLYSRDQQMGLGIDGVKLRALFAVPDADRRRFFYGANFEFSFNADRWDTTLFTSEIRPIIGWHLGSTDIIVNPIVDNSYDGLGQMTFVPSLRIAHNLKSGWAMAVEEYADFGPFNHLRAGGEQAHQLFAVVERSTKLLDFQIGAGVGLTDASDRLTLKLILSKDLNKGKRGSSQP
jgi:hypothetical protein